MANTLTALAPILFSAAQNVSNEPFGVVDSITTSFDDKAVAKGDNIVVPVAPTRAATDFIPSNTASSGDDATASSVIVKITQSKKVSWHLTGEQIRSLDNGGDSKEWARQLVAQGMRTLRNLAEADAALSIKQGASRAYGTAGTTPFGSDISEIPNLYKMLKDNGAPMADMQLVVDTSAGLNLRKLGIIQQAYQAGSDAERRSGKLLRQFGFAINESAGIALHTKGTGTLYVTSGSTAPGVTDIALVTGTNTVLSGDVVTFAADTNNKYIVNIGVAAPGTISLGRPGARVTIATANAMTIGNNYMPNLAFERSAVVGVYRPPIIPENPTIQQMKISDPSGLTFLLLD
ncbi:MAG TPA: hypothetical protein VFR01_01210, partial [Geobacterales bacterium]|nr:hypothetical protein [Geobacterales bacterium]